jgi:ribosomal protein L7Ae-like RNA K-turn-binding protein
MTKPLNELSREECEARLLSTAGFAARAGRIVFGTEMICDNLRRGEILLVLEASDTSDNTHKRLSDKTAFYAVRHVRLDAAGDRLATAFGERGGKIAAVGITDSGIIRAIEKYLPPSAE